MNDEVMRSRARVTRRRALAAGGTVALGALLAGCGLGGSGGGTTNGAVDVTTTDGGTATVTPTTTAADDVAAKLDAIHTCQLTSEETQGPYWFDVDSIRSDVREDRPGTRLDLALRVQDVTGCSAGGAATPVADCVVEIWHCDAGGVYSGFEVGSTGPGGGGAPGGGGPGGSGSGSGGGEESDGSYSEGVTQATPQDDGTFLRGAQVAGADGIVRFTTIFPGWYSGRTVHIHLKVHIDRTNVLTTQLYFEEDVITGAYRVSPYSDRPDRDVMNDQDNIFDESGMLTIEATDDGYLGLINLGIDV